jgi:hypothetical protein
MSNAAAKALASFSCFFSSLENRFFALLQIRALTYGPDQGSAFREAASKARLRNLEST